MTTQTITHEIEYATPGRHGFGEFEYLTVEFTGEIDQEDSAFSFSYGSIEGSTKSEKYLTCGNITWDRSKHTEKENGLILAYLCFNSKEIEDQILAAYRGYV